MSQPDKFLGYEELYPDNATPLSLTKVPTVDYIAYIQCASVTDGNGKGSVAIRFSDDPANPHTSTFGMELSTGAVFVTACDVSKFKFIGVAANARLNVRYEAWPSALNKFF